MKKLLTKTGVFIDLAAELNNYLSPFPPQPTRANLPADEAARRIQQAWRNNKIRDALLSSPFYAYNSMITADDKQRSLSSIMYGHHVAELSTTAKEQINNPFIGQNEHYHRACALDNPKLSALLSEFQLVNFNQKQNDYIPISLLKNNPIEDVFALFTNSILGLKLVKKAPYSIAILIIPKISEPQRSHLTNKLINTGLIASSWEIAVNIQTPFPIPTQDIQLHLNPNLPKTKEELLNSRIMTKLERIADSRNKYPTTPLAICLARLLTTLPPNISSGALQRIATMIDLTNTFYSYHYPRYARCVHTVLHEISLALIENNDPSYIEEEYTYFKEESVTTLTDILDLDETHLGQSRFVAAATTSGTSACAVAMRIASNMNLAHGKAPKVKLFKPCYYELPYTFNLATTEDSNAADIFMISCGPIVTTEGLTPGVDINLLVTRHIINAARTKPVTIIIDTTTALYKNIKLNAEAQQLIATGQLSIIIHESHQKFGLIHSDQAQYGRVLGLCSTEQFNEATLQEIENNTQEDFFTHPDIRIGSFVNTCCPQILEQIKEKHFANGGLLRNTLIRQSLISNHLDIHDDMHRDLDELYFLTDLETTPGSHISKMEYAASGAVEHRASFGHYSLTVSNVGGHRRVSPDASDTIDNLITTSHMRLAYLYGYSAQCMLKHVINYAKKDDLTIAEQIIAAGMLHYISYSVFIIPHNFGQIEYLDQPITIRDIQKLYASPHPKNIIIYKTTSANTETYYLSFLSYGKVFKQMRITDPDFIKLIQSGAVTNPQNHHLVQIHLRSSQKTRIPPQSNLPMIYAAVSKTLETCPKLRNRSAIIDIHEWLSAVRNSIIEEYRPINSAAFLNAIKGLHRTSVLNLNADHESMHFILMLLSQASTVALNNRNFIRTIIEVSKNNQELLKNIEPQQVTKEDVKAYLCASFDTVHRFYANAIPSRAQYQDLIISMDQTRNNYTCVLSATSSSNSGLIYYFLESINDFVRDLVITETKNDHLRTGPYTFFSGPPLGKKLNLLIVQRSLDGYRCPTNGAKLREQQIAVVNL